MTELPLSRAGDLARMAPEGLWWLAGFMLAAVVRFFLLPEVGGSG